MQAGKERQDLGHVPLLGSMDEYFESPRLRLDKLIQTEKAGFW